MDRKSDDDDVLAVAKALRSFPYSFVLVGGAAVPFLLTDPIVSARSTLDFDIVVRIATRGEYYEVEEWLRDHEFTETKDGPICRWRLDEHLIDVMPTSEDVLGFSNQWYEAALQSATRHELEEDISIPVVAAPPFVGAKIEAFRSRGEDDYYASSDLEDIISLCSMGVQKSLMSSARRPLLFTCTSPASSRDGSKAQNSTMLYRATCNMPRRARNEPVS